MANPILQINKEPIDSIIEVIGWIGLVLLIGLPAYYYGQLPDLIPSHFNFSGKVDATSGKGSIWVLPIIGIGLFALLSRMKKIPHKFNYLQKITEANAADQYKIATRSIRLLNAIVIWFLAYIVYSAIQTALGNQAGMNVYISSCFVVLILVCAVYPLFKKF